MISISIPLEKIEVRTSRSGGPGGQHVNKTETKVELRFRLDDAEWIPADVRERLRRSFPSRITSAGDFIISADVHRSQKQNLGAAVEKLRELITACWKPPKARIKTRATRASRERRLQSKKRVGEKKKWRRGD